MMGWFRPSKSDKELIKLIQKSGSDFRFDANSVKFRLLASIKHNESKPVRHFRFSRALWYSASFATLVVMISTTFAFASNSMPGDKLFALNKFGESVVLKLPLSVEQKAKVQEYIVTNRLEALDKVDEQAKVQVVKESDESLMTAVDSITANKQKLEAAGNTKAAEKLETVLDQLQSLAEKREAAIKELGDKTDDFETKAQIQNHLRKIEKSREKARSQIQRYKSSSNDSNKSENDSNDD